MYLGLPVDGLVQAQIFGLPPLKTRRERSLACLFTGETVFDGRGPWGDEIYGQIYICAIHDLGGGEPSNLSPDAFGNTQAALFGMLGFRGKVSLRRGRPRVTRYKGIHVCVKNGVGQMLAYFHLILPYD